MKGPGRTRRSSPGRAGGALVLSLLFLLSLLPVLTTGGTATLSLVPAGRASLEAPVVLQGSALPGGYAVVGSPAPQERVTTSISVSSSSDDGALRAYLAAEGLEVDAPPGMTVWLVNGTVQSLDAAFATQLESFQASGGAPVLSFSRPPSVPDGLPVVAIAPPEGTLGIQDEIADHGPVASTEVDGVRCPAAYSGTLDPKGVEKAYNITPVYQEGYQGQGETIGIVDAYDSAEPANQITSDLIQFSECNGLPNPQLTEAYPIPGQNLNSSGSSGWGLETVLDTQWAHATAPYANIVLALAPNSAYGLYFSVDWLVASRAVNVISLSWGEPEFGIYNLGPCSYQCNASSDGSLATLGPVFAQAASEGVDVFVASGDCGANGGTPAFSPWYPASDPHVIGVGGTILRTNVTGSYASEFAWNGTETLCANGGGSGGGFSQIARPAWQSGPGFGRFTNSTRGVPDVALTAAVPLGIIYNGSPVFVEGTSDAAPQWAGMGALLGEMLGGGNPGFLPPSFYSILRSPAYTRDFHPVVNGSNGFLAGYGWDPLTGIGTPNFANLAQSLIAAPPSTLAAQGSLTLNASPLAGVAPLPWIPLPVNLSVTPWPGSSNSTLYQFYFGDVGQPYQESNASTTDHPWTTARYTEPGAFVTFAVGYGAGGNTSVSNPQVINVGNAGPLTTVLSASTTWAVIGQPVTFTATASGGIGPYRYAYFFGDGTYESGWSSDGPTQSHTYGQNGTYLVTVISNDSSHAIRGGSATTCVIVGNSTTPCPSVPRSLVVSLSPKNSTLVAGTYGNLVTVTVTSNGIPISGATVTLAGPLGTFDMASGVTDAHGEFQTVYSAPALLESQEYPVFANVTAPGFAAGEGQALLLVNPPSGPSVVPSITLDQAQVASGGSDGVLIDASVGISGLLVPGASVSLSTTLGTVSPHSSTVNADGLLAAQLLVPPTSSWENGSLLATASYPGHTSDTVMANFTVDPAAVGTRVVTTLNFTTLPSMASSGITLALQTPQGAPSPGPFASIKASNNGGTYSEGHRAGASLYTVDYSSPPTFSNATQVLSFNVSGPDANQTVGSAISIVNVTGGSGPLLVNFSSAISPLPPRTNSSLVVSLVSKDHPDFPVAYALVVINMGTDSGTLRSANVQWSNAWGRAIFNYTSPDYTGVIPVTITVIGFVYHLYTANASFSVNFPPNVPKFYPDWDAGVTFPLVGMGLGLVAVSGVVWSRRRPSAGTPPGHGGPSPPPPTPPVAHGGPGEAPGPDK